MTESSCLTLALQGSSDETTFDCDESGYDSCFKLDQSGRPTTKGSSALQR